MDKQNPQFLASLCQSQPSLTKNGHADMCQLLENKHYLKFYIIDMKFFNNSFRWIKYRYKINLFLFTLLISSYTPCPWLCEKRHSWRFQSIIWVLWFDWLWLFWVMSLYFMEEKNTFSLDDCFNCSLCFWFEISS